VQTSQLLNSTSSAAPADASLPIAYKPGDKLALWLAIMSLFIAMWPSARQVMLEQSRSGGGELKTGRLARGRMRCRNYRMKDGHGAITFLQEGAPRLSAQTPEGGWEGWGHWPWDRATVRFTEQLASLSPWERCGRGCWTQRGGFTPGKAARGRGLLAARVGHGNDRYRRGSALRAGPEPSGTEE